MEIRRSARKHGLADEAIRHAVAHPLAREELDEHRALWLGPDRAGNLLEVVVLHLDQSDMVIHAMKMRAAYRRLLPGAEGAKR